MHVARSNELTNQETNSYKHALISMCTMQLRLNSCVGDTEYEIPITTFANYIHIPDGAFLVMMQGTRRQQERQPLNHHVAVHTCTIFFEFHVRITCTNIHAA